MSAASRLPRAYLLVALAALASLPAAHLRAQAPTFAAATTYPTAPAGSVNNIVTNGLALADVTGDGRPDVLTTTTNLPNNYASAALVLPAQPGGTLGARSSFAVGRGTVAVVAADLNADGRPDLVTVDRFSYGLSVLLATGPGTFGPAVAYSTGTVGQPQGVAVADVNGDGRPDLLASVLASEELAVRLGTGNGTFGALATFPLNSQGAADLVVADFNADGRPDVAVGSFYQGQVLLLLGNGNGTFQAPTGYAIGGSGASSLAVADLNADGRPDLVTDVGNGVGVLLKAAGSGFQPVVVYPIAGSQGVSDVAVADVTGDGRPDVLTATLPNAANVLPGTAAGTLGAAAGFAVGPAGSYPQYVAAADLNADGRADLVTANFSGNTVSVLLNTTPLATRPALPNVAVALAPNPADAAGTTLALRGLPAAAARVTASLLDAGGRTVAAPAWPVAQGAAVRAVLPVAGLRPGLYLLRLRVFDAQGTSLGELPAQRLAVP